MTGSSSGGSPHRQIAAFDFDGTLTKRDTLIPFLVRVAGRRRFTNVSARLGLLGARRKLPITDRDHVKELMIRDLLGGMEEQRLRQMGEIYARDILVNRMNDPVLERLHEHTRLGHEIIFVSASLVYYLDPIARTLGVNAVIAVEPTSIDGVLDGSLTSPNVRAEQKAVRLAEWVRETSHSRQVHSPGEAPGTLDASGRPSTDGSIDAPDGELSEPTIELWSYGNSSGDHQLLDAADHSFWLGNPRKRPPGVIQFGGQPLAG